MYDKFFVGRDLTGAEDNGEQPPISRVTLLLDDNNSITAGDDTGMELAADCPHATQAMVNAILAQVKGHRYQMYSAEDANIDPSAELGDGVTVDGIYSVISRMVDDGSGYAGLSAPSEADLENEYPLAGPMTQAFNRKISQTNSRITKTAEQIRLEVLNEVEGLSASIDIRLDSINQTVKGLDGKVASVELNVDSIISQVAGLDNQVSSIKLQADSITQEVRNNSESITATLDLIDGFTITDSSGTTKIKGSSIETASIAANSISADKINLTGSITFGDLSQSVQGSINTAVSSASNAEVNANNAMIAASNAETAIGGWTYPGSTYIDGSMLMTGTVKATSIQGGSVSLLDYYGLTSGVITITPASSGVYAVDLTSYAALRLSANSGLLYLSGGPDVAVGCDNFYPLGHAANLGTAYSGMWNAVYAYTSEIVTSDRNRKHDIGAIPDKYMDMLDQIEPVRFKVDNGTSDRYHIGFIAQDVECAMRASGINSKEFAGWCKDEDAEGNELQMLRYTEFIPLCVEQIRRLKGRITELEGRIS